VYRDRDELQLGITRQGDACVLPPVDSPDLHSIQLLSTARSACQCLFFELVLIDRSIRVTATAPTAIPTPPFPGFSYLSSLRRGDVIEIQGPSGSGKTHLLYYLVCSCILPPHFGGWNKVSVIFDTDGSFDVHRLRVLLESRLTQYFPSHNDSTGQIISVALRNVHLFQPSSSSHLAAGLANLPRITSPIFQPPRLPFSPSTQSALFTGWTAFRWSDTAQRRFPTFRK
jgi:hypothetical protein